MFGITPLLSVVRNVVAIAIPILSLAFSNSSAYAQKLTELRGGVKYDPNQTPAGPTADLRLIKLEWDPLPTGTYGVYMTRTPGFSFSPAIPSGTTSFTDSAWDYDTTYVYQLQGRITGSYFNEQTQQWEGFDNPWSGPEVRVTVRKIMASKAQTVDTRIDMRYSTYQLKDYKFGNGLYRGGLFAGYNADNSKVARTYLQFANLVGPPVSTDTLWAVGGVYLYSPRNAVSGTSASLKARFVANDSWTSTPGVEQCPHLCNKWH